MMMFETLEPARPEAKLFRTPPVQKRTNAPLLSQPPALGFWPRRIPAQAHLINTCQAQCTRSSALARGAQGWLQPGAYPPGHADDMEALGGHTHTVG